MTKREFMRFCENYYGEKYDGVVFYVMDAYLDKKSEKFINSAATVLVKRFSRTNRIVPGPAEIEKYLDEILDGIPHPPRLPDTAESMSEEDRKKVDEMLRNFKKKFPVG
jgi:hypothetical protein